MSYLLCLNNYYTLWKEKVGSPFILVQKKKVRIFG
jgi:hypothetical protein